MPKYLDETGLTRFYDNIADRPVYAFDTVSEMQAATYLEEGVTCHTNGFHASNDGGAAYYTVSTNGTANDMDVLALQGGLLATLVVTEPYVTPEQFGAYGDGTHDDTAAWQEAVGFDMSVRASGKAYLCGQINVTKNIAIDCNNAAFTCNADRLFNCSGEVVTTLAGETDYAAYKAGYSISNASYATYTGFAMLKGTNNFEPSRTHYTGGFVCTFSNGEMVGSYPIDVTGVSIEIVNPITVEISNIGDIKHTNPSTSTRSIEILYGMGCTVRGLTELDGSSYMALSFNCCLNCVADNLNVEHYFASSNNNSYIVALLNSSFCTVQNSHMHNRLWHCVTTGDMYLCYSNKIDNCVLISDAQYAFQDHENALGTNVINSTASGIGVCGLSMVENVTVVSESVTQKYAVIRVMPAYNSKHASYRIHGVRFSSDTSSSTYVGIWVGNSPQVTGNTYHVVNLDIEDVFPVGSYRAFLVFSMPATSNYVVEKICVRNSWMNINAGITSGQTHINISNYVLELVDINAKFGGNYVTVASSALTFNAIVVSNCHLRLIAGNCSSFVFDNLECSGNITELMASDRLMGTGLRTYMSPAVLTSPTELIISDMRWNASTKWFNICSASDGKKYCQYMSNGSMVTSEITA